MTPQISEFSYGFALTNEIVSWLPLSVAPVFPSLIEEGRRGGGYDVKLDAPGVPLFLQFKRSSRMTKKSAKEIRIHQKPLSVPFFRFHLRDGRSIQHDLLLELDSGPNLVFYAAPRFSKLDEINRSFLASRISADSIFVRPRDIGNLDSGPHHVAFDHNNTFLCSDPREIAAHSSRQLQQIMTDRLGSEKRNFRAVVKDIRFEIEDVRRRVRSRLSASEVYFADRLEAPRSVVSPQDQIPTRKPNPPSDPDLETLQEVADAALALNVQLIVAQARDG